MINESSSAKESQGFPKPPPSPGLARKASEKREGRKKSKKSKKGSESPSVPRKLLSRARSSSRESLCSLDSEEVLVRHYSTEDLSVRWVNWRDITWLLMLLTLADLFLRPHYWLLCHNSSMTTKLNLFCTLSNCLIVAIGKHVLHLAVVITIYVCLLNNNVANRQITLNVHFRSSPNPKMSANQTNKKLA